MASLSRRFLKPDIGRPPALIHFKNSARIARLFGLPLTNFNRVELLSAPRPTLNENETKASNCCCFNETPDPMAESTPRANLSTCHLSKLFAWEEVIESPLLTLLPF